MYERMDDDAAFESYPVSYVNDIRVIAEHDNFISINTAIEVDLYGQVNRVPVRQRVQRLGRPI